MDSTAKFPPLKWAQRADTVFITIDVADCKDIKTDIDEATQKLVFSATTTKDGQDVKYACDLELFEPVVKEGSKWNTKGRTVIFSVEKKDKEAEEWWPRLTKEKGKNPLITIDWAKWKDADEEEEGAPAEDPMAGMDMGGMNAFGGGAGGMPGMGMPGMPGMGMGGGPGGFDPAMLQQMMGGQMGGADSDDEEGEESQVDPHAPETKGTGNLDDLDGDETADLKK